MLISQHTKCRKALKASIQNLLRAIEKFYNRFYSLEIFPVCLKIDILMLEEDSLSLTLFIYLLCNSL